MNVIEQLVLMAKLAAGLKTPQKLHLSKATATRLQGQVLAGAEVEGVPRGYLRSQFTLTKDGYAYKGIPLLEDEAIPDGDIYLIGPGGII